MPYDTLSRTLNIVPLHVIISKIFFTGPVIRTVCSKWLREDVQGEQDPERLSDIDAPETSCVDGYATPKVSECPLLPDTSLELELLELSGTSVAMQA